MPVAVAVLFFKIKVIFLKCWQCYIEICRCLCWISLSADLHVIQWKHLIFFISSIRTRCIRTWRTLTSNVPKLQFSPKYFHVRHIWDLLLTRSLIKVNMNLIKTSWLQIILTDWRRSHFSTCSSSCHHCGTTRLRVKSAVCRCAVDWQKANSLSVQMKPPHTIIYYSFHFTERWGSENKAC